MSEDEYPPKHGWTCFHCGETFNTVGGASDHFGALPSAKPGCVIKVSLGSERGLLATLRDTEAELARHMEDDTVYQRELMKQQRRHSKALENAECVGYERGLRDLIRARHEERKAESTGDSNE